MEKWEAVDRPLEPYLEDSITDNPSPQLPSELSVPEFCQQDPLSPRSPTPTEFRERTPPRPIQNKGQSQKSQSATYCGPINENSQTLQEQSPERFHSSSNPGATFLRGEPQQISPRERPETYSPTCSVELQATSEGFVPRNEGQISRYSIEHLKSQPVEEIKGDEIQPMTIQRILNSGKDDDLQQPIVDDTCRDEIKLDPKHGGPPMPKFSRIAPVPKRRRPLRTPIVKNVVSRSREQSRKTSTNPKPTKNESNEGHSASLHQQVRELRGNQLRSMAHVFETLANEMETASPDDIPQHCQNQLTQVAQVSGQFTTQMEALKAMYSAGRLQNDRDKQLGSGESANEIDVPVPGSNTGDMGKHHRM